MLLTIALVAALGGAERHPSAPPDAPRAGWSQPMQPVPDAQGTPPDMPQGAGPRATSGSTLFDTVAVAQPDDGGARGISVSVAGAAPGSFVELTELGAGHTILALVGANTAPNGAVLLSQGALQALGIAPGAGVRVRAALPSPQDQTALRSGAAASARIDAPEVLLKALRKRVPAQTAVVTPPHASARPSRHSPPLRPPAPPAQALAETLGADDTPPPPRVTPRPAHVAAPAPVLRSGFVVQVAALSSAPRAQDLARSLGGRVVSGGGLYRVQLGPYGDAASANRARDVAARRGYRDAHVFRTE